MTRRTGIVLAAAAMLAAGVACAAGSSGPGSFALAPAPLFEAAPAPRFTAATAPDLLAQRAIDREWGPAEDSTYNEVVVPGWKSEGFAVAFSGLLPGTGELYAGENSGWLFLLGEAAAWAERWSARRDADRVWDDMANMVGNPYDPAAGFSFDRLRQVSGVSSTDLERLWAGDRSAYYRALAEDTRYTGGFGGDRPSETYSRYDQTWLHRGDLLRRASLMEMALWLNHLVSAADALRAVRWHNLPLRQQYQLQLGERTRNGARELRAALVRRF